MAVKDATELRRESVEKIYETTDVVASGAPAQNFLFEALKHPIEVMECAMGPVGIRLRDLAEKINSDHPEVGSVMKGVLSDADLSNQICQYIRLAQYAVESKLDKIQLHRACLARVPSALRSLDMSENNQKLVRLFADRALRDKIRNTKKIRPVEMRYIFRKGKLRWEQMPNNFLYYFRYSEAYKDDLNCLNEKIATYESLGCDYMRNVVRDRMATFADHMEDVFCGFHRIKMTDAAAILAKDAGAQYYIASYASSAYALQIPSVYIRKYVYIDNKKYTSIKIPRNVQLIPKAYPYSELEDIASDEIKKVIDHLEKLPEMGGYPAFDHYVVIVPSIAYPLEPNYVTENEASYAFNRREKEILKFNTQEECSNELDKVMIQDGLLHPILLGERDGACYFICHWI